jgi:hypothetical protein
MKVFAIYPEDLSEEDWNYVSNEEVKCGGCNWHTTKLYVIANSKKEAIGLVKSGEAGLCAQCFMELVIEEGYELEIKEDY